MGGLGGIAAGLIGSTIADKLFNKKDKRDMVEDKLAEFNEAPETTDPLKNLYKSRYIDPLTGESPQFDTPEELLAYDRAYLEKYGDPPQPPPQRKVLTAALGGMMESGIGSLIKVLGT